MLRHSLNTEEEGEINYRLWRWLVWQILAAYNLRVDSQNGKVNQGGGHFEAKGLKTLHRMPTQSMPRTVGCETGS